MKKQVEIFSGKKMYLLGTDKEGIKYWLVAPSWDCGWYWGFGYIQTFTNNRSPQKAVDIDSHQHANDFLKWATRWNGEDPILTNTVFSEDEAWELCELFKRFYMFQGLAGYYHRGGTGVSQSPSLGDKKDLKEWNRLNNEVLPEIMCRIIEILEPKKETK